VLNGHMRGSVYKGAVPRARAGESLIMAMDRGQCLICRGGLATMTSTAYVW